MVVEPLLAFKFNLADLFENLAVFLKVRKQRVCFLHNGLDASVQFPLLLLPRQYLVRENFLALCQLGKLLIQVTDVWSFYRGCLGFLDQDLLWVFQLRLRNLYFVQNRRLLDWKLSLSSVQCSERTLRS